MKNYFLKIFRSTNFALKGLGHAYKHDQSFRMETWGVFGYAIIVALAWPLIQTEWLFLILSYSLILITELVNTSVEHMLSRLHPEDHEIIGRSKDIASASVFIAFVFAFFVVATILASRLF